MTEYTIINMVTPEPENKKVLKTIHNAGFFSCCTIRLLDIIEYYNRNGCLPDEVDSSEQFLHYKGYPGENMIPAYFDTLNMPINEPANIRMDCMALQFDSYKNIDFKSIEPFIEKYFTPSMIVKLIYNDLVTKYQLDYPNLCSVFYRGNDKATEMKIASYEMFIEKAKEVKAANPNIRFLVQPDEREFLDAFLLEFPDSIYFAETPMLNKSNTSMFYNVPLAERGLYGAKFFAAVMCLSQCSQVITHSGNGALWLALYRGNADNIHQVFNDQWL